MKIKSVFSSCYLPPISYFKHWINANDCIIDVNEYFVKQTFRNRCVIFGADGKLDLVIPILRRNSKQYMKDVKISNVDNWQKNHWKSLEAAYRSSPYFEYYEDYFFSIYNQKKFDFLVDLNQELLSTIFKLLKTNFELTLSNEYVESSENIIDLRKHISPKNKNHYELNQPIYIQVFSNKFEFERNLSILDLLFNEGSHSLKYIQELS